MAATPPTTEARALEEYWALHADPVFQGAGLTQGNGEFVLLLPGLFSNDLYMHTASNWLKRIGYQPIGSEILWNVGCSKRILQDLTTVVETRLPAAETTFSILGHSRGGLLAKALTTRFSDRVKNLILVGSPLGGMLAAGKDGLADYAQFMQQDNATPGRQTVFNVGRAVTQLIDPDCKSPACDCEYISDLFAPLAGHIKLTSIYSKTDPIVPARSSRLAGATNVEVDGSHSGLMFNRQVYPHIANALCTQ